MIPKVAQHVLDRIHDLPDRSSDLVWRWEQRAPLAPALIDGDVRWSYAELAAAVRAAMDLLRELGIRPGDRVMLVNENGRAIVALLLAAAAIDAWSIIVNARLSGPEIDAIARHSGARRLVFTVGASPDAAAHAARLRAQESDHPLLGRIAVGALNKSTQPEPVFAAGAEQIAVLVYTSGTTGEPKGVMLTHRNLLFIGAISGGMRGFRADDLIYGVLPLSHVFGLASVFLGGLYAGSCFLPRARFNAEQTLQDIRTGVTALQGVPAMYAKLLAHIRQTGARIDGHKLRFTSAGGAPLDPAVKHNAEELFGQPLHNGYGMTEASPSMAMTRVDFPRRDCSVGQALPFVELIVVDPDGKELPQGETGDVWCRGPGVMKGYYRAPDQTRAALNKDGWLITGDVGRFDADESLHIVGRSKELIIRSGFNVFPPEVEGVLSAHPKVVQAAVIGAPGSDGNEDVVAYLQVVPSDPPSLEDLAAFCIERLAPYKRPSRFILCETLPATPTGKVLKHRLAALARPLPGVS
ncbi:MAG TPA: AMP-binding protein [Dongiaceae bacterium]|jgi:acyl-CoA synthetase (AMP-forming)/AMP-acid ligase II|nr:AMP-binding protein [Dongiaceae bacterium]